MTQHLTHLDAATVVAPVNFVRPGSTKPRIFVDEGGRAGFREDFEREERYVPIRNIRGQEDDFQFARDGLAFLRQHSGVEDFANFADWQSVYDAEVQALLKEHAGVAETVVFDHTLRLDDTGAAGRKPVRHAHGDYTGQSGPQRLRDLLPPDTADSWERGRFGIINLWRPINGPVETAPLAFVAPGSLAAGDLVPTDLVYPDRTGEIYELAYNPGQDWVYLAGQDVDEVTLFKTYDSADGLDQRIAPHTAFDLSDQNGLSRPRHSIETRALVRFAKT